MIKYLALFAFLLFQITAQAQSWVARHTLTSAAYQTEFTKWTKEGYRPVMVSGYTTSNADRYAAIFEKPASTPAWVARHGLSAADYQKEFDKWTKDGYRPVQITGNSNDRYTAIFEKANNAPAWVARHGLTGANYQVEFDKWTKQGYSLTDLNAYTVKGQPRFAVVFEKKSNTPAWVARHGMSAATYQTEFNKQIEQGYRLKKVSGYEVNGQAQFAALWEKSGSGAWAARHGLNAQQYQDEFDRMYYQGYRPVWVNGYTVGGKDYYAAIWESKNGFNTAELAEVDKIVEQYMKDFAVPGLSLAIAKEGKLVLAKTYGFADKNAGEKVAPRHRFRIASVSKPITSVAIMKLVEEGKLKLSDKVFGTGAILGTTYGTTPYKTNVDKITIQHLLEHTGGGWSNSSNDPMFSNTDKDQKALISWTLDNRALDNEPGKNYAYSNFGYCVLGRVIEKISGQSYENYVKNQILSKCDVKDMQIAGDTEAQKKANEVVYYGQDSENPYGMKVTRMDAHGGWIANPIDLVRFAVRVDNFTTKPDILKTSSLNTMFTASTANNGYAKGWSVNSVPNYWHNGSLPGDQAFLVRTNSGYCWSVLVNTRSNKEGFGGQLDQLMWNVVGKIKTWPSFNLF